MIAVSRASSRKPLLELRMMQKHPHGSKYIMSWEFWSSGIGVVKSQEAQSIINGHSSGHTPVLGTRSVSCGKQGCTSSVPSQPNMQ